MLTRFARLDAKRAIRFAPALAASGSGDYLANLRIAEGDDPYAFKSIGQQARDLDWARRRWTFGEAVTSRTLAQVEAGVSPC